MASYATVIRVQRVQTSRLAALQRHNARTPRDVLNARERGVDAYENVNPHKTLLNYTLAGSRNIRADIEAANAGAAYARSDATAVAAEFILTMHKDFFNNISKSDTKKWCHDAVCALNEYCISNNCGRVINAIVHLDEDTPHIHVITSVKTEVFLKNISRGEKISYGTCWGDTKKTISDARKAGTLDTATKLGRLQTGYTKLLQKKGWDVKRGTIDSKAEHQAQREYHKKNDDELQRIFIEKSQSIIAELIKKYNDIAKEAQLVIDKVENINIDISNSNYKKAELQIELLQSLLKMREHKNIIDRQKPEIKNLIKFIDDNTTNLLTAIRSKRMRNIRECQKNNRDNQSVQIAKMRFTI